MTKPKPAPEDAGLTPEGEGAPADPPAIVAPFDLMHNGKVFLSGFSVTDPEVIAAFNLA
jgi:hypothetical protein